MVRLRENINMELDWKVGMEVETTESVLRWPSSPMLKQLVKIYTPLFFDVFQDEFDLMLACCVKQKRENGSLLEYVIDIFDQEGEWKVLFHPQEKLICCSCRLFETIGMVCCHILKVFDANNIKKLPDQYILKLWTKEAKNCVIHDVKGKEVDEVSESCRKLRHRDFLESGFKLAWEASRSEEGTSLFLSGLKKMTKEIMAHRLREMLVRTGRDAFTEPSSSGMSQPIGIKKRFELQRNRRLKSRVELRRRKRTLTSMSQPTISYSQSEQFTDIRASSQMQFENGSF